MNEDKRGFTLIELIIALSIISILIFLAILNYAIAVHKSKDIACQANLKTLRKAIEMYYVNTGDYPNSLDELKPNYIRENFEFKCPRSGLSYTYNPETHQVSCTYPPHANY